MIIQSECKEMSFTVISTQADKVCRYCCQSFMQTSARKVAILKYTKIEIYTNNIQNFIETNLKASLIHSRKRRGLCGQSLI